MQRQSVEFTLEQLINSWVAFTIFAALMQAIRTAGQKQLSVNLTPLSATLVRYLYGLPFVVLYLLYLQGNRLYAEVAITFANNRFLLFACLAAFAQIIATVLLVKVFSFRNFAVGTSFVKTEAVQTAVFALVFFGAALSVSGWIAVLVGFIGIAVISVPTATQEWQWRSVVIGLLSGAAFSFTSLWLREASLSLDMPVLHSAAMTLLFMVVLQTAICLVYSLIMEPGQLAAIVSRSRLALFVGLTSALGSIGWFTAMTLQNPALVKSLGQIEFIFAFLITTQVFREKITQREFIGMLLIIISVLILLN
jgi:drug/metabolite transporter (DMT)-like permease